MDKHKIEEYDAWIFPKCFMCNGDIIGSAAVNPTLFEFKCECRTRVITRTDYEIMSVNEVMTQTLFFNHELTRANRKWIEENVERIPTKDLYMELRRKVILEEI